MMFDDLCSDDLRSSILEVYVVPRDLSTFMNIDRSPFKNNIYKPSTVTFESNYQIRPARFEELPMLSQIEQSAARLFLDTPYAFLVNDDPLSLDFVRQQFHAGRVWVAVDLQETVVGYAIVREVDETLYLQQIDVEPEHGRRGIGSALITKVCDWAQQQGYASVSLSTGRGAFHRFNCDISRNLSSAVSRRTWHQW